MEIFTRFLEKSKKYNTAYYLSIIVFLFNSLNGFGQATFSAGSTDAQLVTQLQGPGVIISNPTLENGNRPTQVGVFSDGIGGAGFQIDSGVCLSTGSVAQAFQANAATQATIDAPGAATYNDPDITAIDPTATRDVVVFSFDVDI